MNAKEKCCYEFGTFRLDTAEHTLFHKGQAVHLTPKAIETLLVLVENHGHLVEKDELLEKVWEGSFVEESNIAKNISVLRKTLSGNGLKEPIIETIPTRGYRFVTPLNETEVDAPQEATVEIGAPQAGKDPDRAKLARSSKNNRVVPILSVGIIAAIAGLAVGGWYFLPSLIRGDEPNAKTTQVSLSNGFERVSGGVISPDGKLVAFRRIREGKQETLAVRRLADGETIDLVPDLDRDFAIYATFSPDSKSVYYNRYRKDNEGVYRVPVTGGPVERLIAGRYSDVAVSRDGNQLAFYRLHPEKTEGTVLVADKNGNNEKAISTVKLTNLYNQLVFSNDGQRVLIWEHIKEGMYSAKWVNIDDKTETEAKLLTPILGKNWVGVGNPVLLKDGSGFLFKGRTTSMDRQQIFHLRAVDGKITQITPDGRGNCCRFSVSDDGKTIVLNRGPIWSFNMISYDPVTKESRQIMNNNKGFVPWRSISQMPDGRILFANRTEKGSDIYLMNKDGGNEIRLTTGTGFKANPVASADGKYIFFSSTRSGAANIWRMDADGGNPVRLTNYLNKELGGVAEIENINRSIQITNDGKTVFFAQQPKHGERSKLMKIPVNGGKAAELLPTSLTSNFAPRISPDGKKLAYLGFVYDSKTSQNKFAVYIRSLKGDSVGELEKKHPFNLSEWGLWKVHWTPDGKAVTYNKRPRKDQIYNIWKLDIETGKETAVTSFESESDDVNGFHWSNDGKKILIVRWLRASGDLVMIKNRDISKKLY